MTETRESILIALATPLYVFVIIGEMLFSWWHNKKYYTATGVAGNVYLMILNLGLDLLMRGACLLVLGYFYEFRFFEIENPALYWIILLFALDLLYYLLHVVDHYCRIFWAVHVTHHSSEEFNFTVGFRSSVFQPLYRFIYFIPLALSGFKAIDIVFVYAVTQVYGILLHTQWVGKLGLLEYFFVTPSHHRVHHGSNPEYLDRNMGMLFIIWDRIFGTFQEEKERVQFGLTTQVHDKGPVNILFHEWKEILRDLRKATSWKDRVKYLFYRPGWSPDGSRKTSRVLREEYRRINR